MSEPRLHHILPVFYLSGFTDTGTREGWLHVFDYFRRGKRYRARPTKVARERDYYRIYELEVDQNAVEKELDNLESSLAPVLHEVIERRTIKSPKELGSLLSLAALIHARGPRARDNFSVGLENRMREGLISGNVSKEEWEKIVEAEKRAGVDPALLPSYEEARRLVKEGTWSPKAPQLHVVDAIRHMQRAMFDLLLPHVWSLAAADPGSAEFVCSDSPLTWSTKEMWEPGWSEDERLDDPNVTVMFPLSKSLALITCPYDRDNPKRFTYQATEAVVAWVNSRTQLYSYGMLYSASPDFLLLQKGNKVGHSQDYFAHMDLMWSGSAQSPPE
jgi:hypothetical protein